MPLTCLRRVPVYDSLYSAAHPFLLRQDESHADNATATGASGGTLVRQPGQAGRWQTGSESEVKLA